jgi:pimeloyl-ACP methyl ester carboxylesterase
MAEISPGLYRAGEGEPLVLIHGFTATWRNWLPVLPELVARFEVIAPTLHGHDGGPPIPHSEAARSSEDAADHLEQHLDELGLGKVHVAGNSLGGALALELAKRGRALSVVALSPGGGWRHEDRVTPQKVIKYFTRTQKMTRMALPYAERIMKSPFRRRLSFRDVMRHGELLPPDEAVRMMASSLRCTVIDEVFDLMRRGEAPIRDLDRIVCPVLVAWAEHDRILPMDVHSPRYREEIPGGEFRVLHGVGHVPMWDDPTLVAGTIAEFTAAAAAAAAARAKAPAAG